MIYELHFYTHIINIVSLVSLKQKVLGHYLASLDQTHGESKYLKTEVLLK